MAPGEAKEARRARDRLAIQWVVIPAIIVAILLVGVVAKLAL